MTVWLTIIGFLIGVIIGSFVKALADRSLIKRSFWGRSYCPKCKHKLHWYDLFPILSFISTNGKCRYCGDSIGVEYLVVEVGMGILVGHLFLVSFSDLIGGSINNWIPASAGMTSFLLELLFKTFFITVLAILFLTDLKKMFIPDRVVIPAIMISLVYLMLSAVYKMSLQLLFGPALMALLIGSFFMALIIITKGKGMGGGDVKLGVFMGLALGFPGSLVALIIAFLSGAIVSLMLIAGGKKHFGQVIPFGPFLVLGSLTALFWGDKILEWYLTIN